MNDAIQQINGNFRSHLTGKGICMAILDTGISPIADFTLPHNRIACFVDFINNKKEPYDDNGHGTHEGVPYSEQILLHNYKALF